jgi:hypothetical protein
MSGVKRDTLFLLPTKFGDTALPGRTFYCRDCITVTGLLSAFPERAEHLEIVTIGFARPRQAVIDLVGEKNQGLPLLLLADDAPRELAGGEANGVRFVTDLPALLHALHVRHGFPEAHP